MHPSRHPVIRQVLAAGASRPSSPLSPLSLRFSSSSSSLSSMTTPPISPAPMSPRGTGTTTTEWKKTYNQTPDQCVWPLPPPSKDTKQCNFPFKENPVIQNIQTVTLPAGTELFHATQILPSQKIWFTNMTAVSFDTLPKKIMWFASSPEHAKHMNYTHVLKFKTKKDIKLVFIRNLLVHIGSNTGNELLKNPEFASILSKDPELVGYVGCNECEIGIFKHHLADVIELPPEVLETRSYMYITGGGSRRRRRQQRRQQKRRQTYKKRNPRPTLE